MQRRAAGWLLLSAFLLALTLAVAPQLHERLHSDSADPAHNCAVTLIASGSYDHCIVPVVISAPRPATQFATLPSLSPVWVAAPFLGASIFEHAPPVVS
jgi:hypothetical protein